MHGERMAKVMLEYAMHLRKPLRLLEAQEREEDGERAMRRCKARGQPPERRRSFRGPHAPPSVASPFRSSSSASLHNTTHVSQHPMVIEDPKAQQKHNDTNVGMTSSMGHLLKSAVRVEVRGKHGKSIELSVEPATTIEAIVHHWAYFLEQTDPDVAVDVNRVE